MSTWIYFTTMAAMFGTILAIFGMRYYAQIQQARSRIEAQTENTALLTAIKSDLADVRTRLTEIEKVLKTVE